MMHDRSDACRQTAGENDVTIIFKSEAAGRRWQHYTHNGAAEVAHQNGAGHLAELQQTERNYTVILGSHRNTCIKVEKDGQLCDRVRRPVLPRLTPHPDGRQDPVAMALRFAFYWFH